MSAALAHRGPDAGAQCSVSGCDLGHRRLSIIDLSTGDQPMVYCDRWWITYNGEIYNYRALRAQLEAAGHSFRSQSDTEVILAAYAEWGSDCLSRLRGMFAFAIWDTREQQLFVARDLFGEKPLYYARGANGSLVLGSELKSVLASGLVTPVLDRGAVDEYLVLGYVPPHRTIYSNVQTLPGAHCLQYDNGTTRVTRYWQPRLGHNSIGMADAAEELERLLRQSVRRQLESDVPVGAFLSGGIDSSTIVALAQNESASRIQTFSVGFGDTINELPYARAVAERYGTDHHEIDLGTPAVAELLERMIAVYDEPFADSSHIPTYLVAEFARQSVKVVLSGDGGDELFGGYGRYPSLQLASDVRASWMAWAVLRLVSRAMRDRQPRLHRYSVAVGLRARARDGWSRCLLSQANFTERQRRELWQGEHAVPSIDELLTDDCLRPTGDMPEIDRSFHFDLTTYLPGDILVKVDRAAMAHGLETRAPMLDRDVAEFAIGLPAAMKFSEADSKLVLRAAARRYLPETVLTRSKQGFGAPYSHWLERPDVQSLVQRVFANGSRLRDLLPGIRVNQHRARDYRTWTLLTLGLWLERQAHL